MTDHDEDVATTPAGQAATATIGASIVVRGEVTGEEDLVVNGRIEGGISLAGHTVVIGENGRIAANVQARRIEVQGHLEGDLRAEEQVVIRANGDVSGNITAPSVVIENGSRFRGSVDMDMKPSAEPRRPATKPVMMAAAEKFTAEKY